MKRKIHASRMLLSPWCLRGQGRICYIWPSNIWPCNIWPSNTSPRPHFTQTTFHPNHISPKPHLTQNCNFKLYSERVKIREKIWKKFAKKCKIHKTISFYVVASVEINPAKFIKSTKNKDLLVEGNQAGTIEESGDQLRQLFHERIHVWHAGPCLKSLYMCASY